jgi:DNA modification methylase
MIDINPHRLFNTDARNLCDYVEPGSVQCCVTSPPYWGLRDYQVDGQIGLEETPDEYVAKLVDVFRGVRKMLRADGALLLNLGDSYAATTKGAGGKGKQTSNAGTIMVDRRWQIPQGLKPKDLVGIPWMVAFALRADGWWLRSDIIWSKPNPMPESVTDRPTKAHEYVFLLSKSADYFWDAGAIREIATVGNHPRIVVDNACQAVPPGASPHTGLRLSNGETRNARSVWTISPVPFAGAHFATMPPELARRCIAAGSRIGDTVCDPFAGALTTAVMAHKTGRLFAGSELSADYCEMGRRRLSDAMAQQTLDFGTAGQVET